MRFQQTTIEEAGFTVFLSHTSKVCELLRDILHRDSDQQMEQNSNTGTIKRCLEPINPIQKHHVHVRLSPCDALRPDTLDLDL